MNKLTKHLALSTMAIALAGGMGLAHAQSSNGAMGTTDTTGTNATGTNPAGTNATGTNPNSMSANPDPNGTLSRSSRTGNRANHSATTNTPGAFNGEAADSNEPYGRARTQQGSQDNMSQPGTEPATRGESARSNNSYGHSRDDLNSDEATRGATTR